MQNGRPNQPMPSRTSVEVSTSVEVEAWSSGLIVVAIEGESYEVRAAVELLRIGLLVQVLARADAEDAKLAGFPIVANATEWFPLTSLAPDRLAELGRGVTEQFLAQLRQVLQANLEVAKVAAAELAKLAEQSQSSSRLAELGEGSPTPDSDPLVR